MSTKIYNGFRLKRMSLNSLHEWAMDFRQKIAETNKLMVMHQRATICARLIDLAFVYDSTVFSEMIKKHDLKLSDYPSIAAMRIMDDRQREIRKTEHRDPEYDYDCSLVLIPVKSDVLGLYYTEREQHIQILKNMPHYEEYVYWNNTDRPAELSKYRWDARQKNWDSALAGVGIPKYCGFTVYCDPADWYISQSVIPYMPSLEKRVESISLSIVSNGFKGTLSDYLDWIKTPNYKNLLNSTRTELVQILRPNIAKEDVITSFEEIYAYASAGGNHGFVCNR